MSVSNSARVIGSVRRWPSCATVMLACSTLRERPLGALGGGVEHRGDCGSVARIGVELLLELLRGPVDEAVVPVLAAEPHVALDGEDLEALLAELHERDVEGAAAEVVDEHGLAAFPSAAVRLHGVGERRGGGFIDDVEDVEPRDLAGVHRRLAAGVVEVRGHGDDAALDGTELPLRHPVRAS